MTEDKKSKKDKEHQPKADQPLAEKETKKVVVVEPKPVEEKKDTAPTRVDNIKVDKIGSLTLNLFAEPLKKRYEKHYKENKMHLITDIVLVAIILILLGVILNIWLFSRSKLFNLIDFQVSSNPEQLINGQETVFTIDYTNTTKDTLTDVTLVLKRPPSLHNPEYNIEDFDLKTNTLKIDELASGAHGQFKIKGFFLGNLHTKQEFLAVINYKNKYGQSRQEFFKREFELNGSALKAEMSLPERVIATSPFETKLYIKNISEINFDNLKIKMVWPENFIFTQTDLEDGQDQTWAIGNYTVGQENNYAFTGKAYVNQPQNITLASEIFVNYDGSQYLLAKAQKSVFVDFSKFKLNLTNLENIQSITPGGQATYTLFYKNEENYPVTNVELGLNLKGAYAANSQIRLNQNTYPQLAKMEPEQEGSIDITASAKSAIDFTSPSENGYQLEVRGFASYNDPVENSRISVESQPMITKVNSRLSLNTLGLFYTPQGDQIGVGSVPPVVGEYTSYWVIIKALNTNNPVKDLKITAQVPASVEFTNIYNVSEGNQIIFHEGSMQIEWRVNNVPALAGIFNPAPEARIQLAIVPSSSQVGTSPALLTNISATATDEVTGAFLTASGQNITTAIFSDESLNKVVE